MTQLTAIVFAVKIPEDIDNLIIQDGWLVDNWADEEYIPIVKLPPGSYTLLFCTKDKVTEEMARKIIPTYGLAHAGTVFTFKDYTGEYMGFVNDAFSSFTSLLQSKNLSGNHAILFNKV